MQNVNPVPAGPGYALPVQTVNPDQLASLKKPTDLDLHCLTVSR